MLNYNLPYFRRTVHPVVNMQVIDAIGQAGYVKMNRAAFGSGLAEYVALIVVEADVVCGIWMIFR